MGSTVISIEEVEESARRGQRMKTRLRFRESRLQVSRNRKPGKGNAVWPGCSPLFVEAHGLQDAGTAAAPISSSINLTTPGS